MADDPEADADESGEKKPKRKFGGPAKIAGLVLTVMLVEAGVLYVLLAPAEAVAVEDLPDSKTEELAEVEIDAFTTTNARAIVGRTVHLTFELTIVVPKERVDDVGESVTGSFKARIRQAVLEVARAANSDDLDDPRLRGFKTDLANAVNTVLKEDVVRNAVVSEFKALEQ
ncbi:MAG: flagellar basal body-associated FliL family protein [Planctomycetota bacterium]